MNFNELEAKYGIPQGLLSAVRRVESGGRNALSSAGALGEFQFMPSTAKSYGIDPLNPAQAAEGAARMFADLGKQYKGNWNAAIAHYNGGTKAGNAVASGSDAPYQETRNYVPKVVNAMSSNQKEMSVEDAAKALGFGTDNNDVDAAAKLLGLGYGEPKKIGREGFADALKSVVADQDPITAAIAQGGNTAMQYLRGMRQLAGFGDTKEGKNQDALRNEINTQFPIAGPVGDIGAQIGLTYLGAKALPTGLISSKIPMLANPYASNASIGAALGGLKYGDLEQRATDAGLGAAGGAVGTLAGRAIPAVYGGLKGVVEPFTKKGQENIVGRTLRQFAVDPTRVEQAANYSSRVPGVNPTLAESALDPGISNLQRQFAVGTADQQLANNAARINAMRSAGGTDSAITAAENARSSAAKSLYGQAYADDAARLSSAQPGDDISTPGLRELTKRPAFQSAIKEAKTLAANMGEDIGDPITSVKGLHYIKMALDEGFKNPQSSLAAFGQKALTNTKSTLLSELETISPIYKEALNKFAELSKPINSMQIGNEILRKSSSAAEDALGNPTLRNEALSRVMRDGDQVAKSVTKFNKATLRDSLDPMAYQTIADVRKDLARKAASENLGRAAGSPTAQNLAAQNVMRQIAGPLGAPSGFAEANIWPTLLRPVNWAMKAQDPKIENMLIKALSDPKFASELAKRKQTQKAIGSLLGPFENYAVPGISGGLLTEYQ